MYLNVTMELPLQHTFSINSLYPLPNTHTHTIKSTCFSWFLGKCLHKI